MEYAMSYALYNFRRLDQNGNYDADNLELIREFEGSKSETGFVAVHVAMVQHSGDLVKYVQQSLDDCRSDNREGFRNSLKKMLETLKIINVKMNTMWDFSRPKDYDNFRTFIMGTKNQPMFPKGVIYEGVSEEPYFLRGESGANDSIVPTVDNFLEIT